MQKKKTACDPTLLSRFMDGELTPEAHEGIVTHLRGCPDCRRALTENRRLSSLLQNRVAETLETVNFLETEQMFLGGVRGAASDGINQRRRWRRLLTTGLIPPRRVYASVLAATAAVVVFVLVLLGRPTAVPGPSAIVKSFQGPVQSVMILETPRSHETILWISERSPENQRQPVDEGPLGRHRSSGGLPA